MTIKDFEGIKVRLNDNFIFEKKNKLFNKIYYELNCFIPNDISKKFGGPDTNYEIKATKRGNQMQLEHEYNNEIINDFIVRDIKYNIEDIFEKYLGNENEIIRKTTKDYFKAFKYDINFNFDKKTDNILFAIENGCRNVIEPIEYNYENPDLDPYATEKSHEIISYNAESFYNLFNKSKDFIKLYKFYNNYITPDLLENYHTTCNGNDYRIEHKNIENATVNTKTWSVWKTEPLKEDFSNLDNIVIYNYKNKDECLNHIIKNNIAYLKHSFNETKLPDENTTAKEDIEILNNLKKNDFDLYKYATNLVVEKQLKYIEEYNELINSKRKDEKIFKNYEDYRNIFNNIENLKFTDLEKNKKSKEISIRNFDFNDREKVVNEYFKDIKNPHFNKLNLAFKTAVVDDMSFNIDFNGEFNDKYGKNLYHTEALPLFYVKEQLNKKNYQNEYSFNPDNKGQSAHYFEAYDDYLKEKSYHQEKDKYGFIDMREDIDLTKYDFKVIKEELVNMDELSGKSYLIEVPVKFQKEIAPQLRGLNENEHLAIVIDNVFNEPKITFYDEENENIGMLHDFNINSEISSMMKKDVVNFISDYEINYVQKEEDKIIKKLADYYQKIYDIQQDNMSNDKVYQKYEKLENEKINYMNENRDRILLNGKIASQIECYIESHGKPSLKGNSGVSIRERGFVREVIDEDISKLYDSKIEDLKKQKGYLMVYSRTFIDNLNELESDKTKIIETKISNNVTEEQKNKVLKETENTAENMSKNVKENTHKNNKSKK